MSAYDLARRARAQQAVRVAKQVQDIMGFQATGTSVDNIVQKLEGCMDWSVARNIDNQNQQAVMFFEEASGGDSRSES
jgi:hypothetical protein